MRADAQQCGNGKFANLEDPDLEMYPESKRPKGPIDFFTALYDESSGLAMETLVHGHIARLVSTNLCGRS